MTAHPIPADADLIALVSLSKQWEIEDALALRKQRRGARSNASKRGWQTRRIHERSAIRERLT